MLASSKPARAAKCIFNTKADRANQKMLREMIIQIAKEKRKNRKPFNFGNARRQLVWFFDDFRATLDFFEGMPVEQIADKYGRSALATKETLEIYVPLVAEYLREALAE